MGKLFFQDSPSCNPQKVTLLILSECLLKSSKMSAYRFANWVCTESGRLSGYGFMVGLFSNLVEMSAVDFSQGLGKTEMSSSVNITFTPVAAYISMAVSISSMEGSFKLQWAWTPTPS